MKPYLFVSDLHLCTSRPAINAIFFRFIATEARDAAALYVLGDLFEYWAGDDDLADGLNKQVAEAFHSLSSAGVPVFLMHGNRDFLLGDGFISASGATLLHDPTTIDLYGKSTLLSHGDMWCEDDIEYQTFRQQVRSEVWRQQFLALPLTERRAQIEALRERSETDKKRKAVEIMDVTPMAIINAFRISGCRWIIHGHTHRPAQHTLEIDSVRRTRWVLADWYDSGSYLCVDERGGKVITLTAL